MVYIQSAIVSLVATVASILLANLFIEVPMTLDTLPLLETFATFASFACTYLCVHQKRANYYVALVSVTALSVVFYQQNLLGSMALNLYLIPTVIYGWYLWGKSHTELPVTHTSPKQFVTWVGITAIVYVIGVQVIKYFGGEVAYLDGIILFGSILAQFFLDRRHITTWACWAVVNIISIYVYYNAGLYLLTIQFVFFLANTVYGYVMWNQTMKYRLSS